MTSKTNKDLTESRAKQVIFERYHALLAEGVQRFAPPVSPQVSPRSEDSKAVDSSAQTVDSNVGGVTASEVAPASSASSVPTASGARHQLTEEDVARCSECRLCEGRLRVAVQRPWRPARVFVLAELVTVEDESASLDVALFSAEKSPSQVLDRLFGRLGLPPQGVHRAFAVKCIARKGIGRREATTCATRALAPELAAVRPEVVLCFGTRAREAFLSAAEGGLSEETSPDEVTMSVAWGKVRALFLPSALELERWPEWRSGVWEALGFLRA